MTEIRTEKSVPCNGSSGLQNSLYICDSPKNACGIQTKGLERVEKADSETGAIRSRQSTRSALRALRVVNLIQNKTNCVTV